MNVDLKNHVNSAKINRVYKNLIVSKQRKKCLKCVFFKLVRLLRQTAITPKKQKRRENETFT